MNAISGELNNAAGAGAAGAAGAAAGADGGATGGADSSAAAGAGAGAGEGAGGGDSGAGAGSGSAAPKPWMNILSPDFRENERLQRFESPDAMAQSLLNAESFARGRVALPKDGDEASRQEFISKVRPETPDAYTVKLPEGTDPASAQAFKNKAHEIGLAPWQAEALSEFDMTRQGMAVEQMTGKARQELDALKYEMTVPVYERNTQAVANMLSSLNIEGLDKDKALAGLESAYGAGATMKLLIGMAQKTGELEKVDPLDIDIALGNMTPENARSKQEQLAKDPEFMAKAAKSGTPEAQQWKALNAAQVKKPA